MEEKKEMETRYVKGFRGLVLHVILKSMQGALYHKIPGI